MIERSVAREKVHFSSKCNLCRFVSVLISSQSYSYYLPSLQIISIIIPIIPIIHLINYIFVVL